MSMKSMTAEESAINRLIELGTVTYETAGWGTGKVSVKCRSNTRCEKESLNKPLIALSVDESAVQRESIEDYVIQELARKLRDREIRVLTIEDKRYNSAKRKFKLWKNAYKSENRSG
ncbi:MAG: hypothetical protein NC337_10885 [Roseburia sp.]|nr:hypothetical protein [Roseburia sp.]